MRKLSAYAAGGVALVAVDASAAIVYTDLGPSGVPVFDGTFEVDLNDDGVGDFELSHRFEVTDSYYTNTDASVRVIGSRVIGTGIYNHVAAKFDKFDLIDPLRANQTNAVLVWNDHSFTDDSGGPFACTLSEYCQQGSRGYLGLAFALDGPHSGWIDIHAKALGGFTIFGFAYETEGGVPILAGDTGIPTVPGDTNADGVVDLEDLNNVLNNFAESGAVPGDTNQDGFVDLEDLNAVRNNFGAGNPVPEPPSLLLLAAGAAGLGALRATRKRVAFTKS